MLKYPSNEEAAVEMNHFDVQICHLRGRVAQSSNQEKKLSREQLEHAKDYTKYLDGVFQHRRKLVRISPLSFIL